MPAVTEALRHLQNVETQLRASRDMLNRKKRSLRVHEKRIATLSEQIEAKQHEIKEHQAHSANQELELRGKQEQIDKKRTQLNAVKTNKEYAAILAEIRNEEADNGKYEETILQTLAQVDQCTAARKDLETQLAKERGAMEALMSRLSQDLNALENRISQLEAQRDTASREVSEDVMVLFERIAERHDGEVLAKIECVDERSGNWICRGCNMGIPIDTVNQLQTSEEVIRCRSCSRILYFEQ